MPSGFSHFDSYRISCNRCTCKSVRLQIAGNMEGNMECCVALTVAAFFTKLGYDS